MMIKLSLTTPSREKVLRVLRATIDRSRFNVNSYYQRDHPRSGKAFKGGDISIDGVRLKTRRFYWGNRHEPSDRPSEKRGWGSRISKPARLGFLMAADWVEFNDLVNDVLDELQVKATFFSRFLILRRGTRRRVRYSTKWGKNQWGHECDIWNKQGDPKDFVCNINRDLGFFPLSEFPDTCPGVYRATYRDIPSDAEPAAF